MPTDSTTSARSAKILSMPLDPDAYPCRVHEEDLTRDVEDELEQMPVSGFTIEPQNGEPAPRAGTPFTVVVTCPGPEPHPVVFKGRILDDA